MAGRGRTWHEMSGYCMNNAEIPNDLTPNYQFLNLDLTKGNEIKNKRDETNGYAPYTNKKQESPQSDFQVGS